MKVDAVVHCETNGKSVADEVNIVTAHRELFTQLCRDHPASSVSWIARDPNLHISTT